MKKNLEIEYKCGIKKKVYKRLLDKYNLNEKVYVQINHYFDTEGQDLFNNHITLRIRQKGEQYKLTKKVKVSEGTEETHLYLTPSQGKDMIISGFNGEMIQLPYDFIKVGELTTYRAKTPYKEGELFLDKSTYGDSTDYEIEIEVPSKESKHIFKEFLKDEKIKFKKLKSKSYRCFKYAYKKRK